MNNLRNFPSIKKALGSLANHKVDVVKRGWRGNLWFEFGEHLRMMITTQGNAANATIEQYKLAEITATLLSKYNHENAFCKNSTAVLEAVGSAIKTHYVNPANLDPGPDLYLDLDPNEWFTQLYSEPVKPKFSQSMVLDARGNKTKFPKEIDPFVTLFALSQDTDASEYRLDLNDPDELDIRTNNPAIQSRIEQYVLPAARFIVEYCCANEYPLPEEPAYLLKLCLMLISDEDFEFTNRAAKNKVTRDLSRFTFELLMMGVYPQNPCVEGGRILLPLPKAESQKLPKIIDPEEDYE